MRLVLDWREHGSAALASPDVTPGGGFLLIERSLAVNGGVGMRRSEPGGFAWEIVLPLPGLPAYLAVLGLLPATIRFLVPTRAPTPVFRPLETDPSG